MSYTDELIRMVLNSRGQTVLAWVAGWNELLELAEKAEKQEAEEWAQK